MNVSELKRAVLRNMNEKDDEQTVLELGDEILSYLNDGYLNAVATKIKPVKRVMCKSEMGRIPLEGIAEDFNDIVRVLDKYGMDTRFSRNSEYIFVDDGVYEVEYIYLPKELIADEDVPLIDKAFHYILSDYATYRMFLKGSKARQGRGDVFLSSYLNGMNKLTGISPAYIRNKYGSDING